MKLKGFILYNDKSTRVPPGCLVFYPANKQLIATSDSPYSVVMLNKLKTGIRLPRLDRLNNLDEIIVASGDVEKFLTVAAEFFASAGLKSKVCDITPPLRGELYFDSNFSILSDKAEGCITIPLKVHK